MTAGNTGTSRDKTRTVMGKARKGKQKSLIIPDCLCLVPAWLVPAVFGVFSLLVPVLFLFCLCWICLSFISAFSETSRDSPFLSLSVHACPCLSPYILVCPPLSLSVPLRPSFLVCPCLSLTVPICPRLSLSVPVYPCLSLSVPVCTCMSLSVPFCPCMPMYAPVCTFMSWTIPVCQCLSLYFQVFHSFSLFVPFLSLSLSYIIVSCVTIHTHCDPVGKKNLPLL